MLMYVIFSEISRLQAGGSRGCGFKDPIKYVDVYEKQRYFEEIGSFINLSSSRL